MKKDKHDRVLRKLVKMNTDEEKVEYLESVIEATDNDNNGFNSELADKRNELNDRIQRKKRKNGSK